VSLNTTFYHFFMFTPRFNQTIMSFRVYSCRHGDLDVFILSILNIYSFNQTIMSFRVYSCRHGDLDVFILSI